MFQTWVELVLLSQFSFSFPIFSLSLYFSHALPPLPSSRLYSSGMQKQQGLVEREGPAQCRRFVASKRSSLLNMIEVFVTTTSAAWSHDLHVSKMSEVMRKRGQKNKEVEEEEEEEQEQEEQERGGEGIYIIVVETLSNELLAI